MAIQGEYDYSTFDNIYKYLKSDNFFVFDVSLSKNNIKYENSIGLDTLFDNEEYLIKSKIHIKEPISEGPDFKYKINKDGFRTKHLEKLNSDNTNVLFLGCSVTSGVGLPEELVWTSIVTDEMNKKFGNVVSYNLAVHGTGVDQNFHNLRVFIDKYGKPDYVFILLPGFERFVIYNQEGRLFLEITKASKGSEMYKKFRVVKELIKHGSLEDLILSAVEKIHMIEFLCKSLDIKLLWSTWHEGYMKICEEVDFKNYIHVHTKEIPENKNNTPYWAIARDLSHFGSAYHEIVANKFLKHIDLT